MRSIFVISDLHLGGAYPDPPEVGKRGFRLCTRADAIVRFVDERTAEIAKSGPGEIVLNGDTVDFLAERDQPMPAPATWSSFTVEPQAAVAKFKAIVARDKEVFAAFGRFLDAGGRLVVLLGNHDIELSLPAVRAALRAAFGVKPAHDFEFLYDGEAYVVGDALIEHGNRYDAWNQIDYDALRHVRSFQSRSLPVPGDHAFTAPPGSDMVTRVINAIKSEYAFVDLLKPETEAVAPMLLALEPGLRAQVAVIALLFARSRRHGMAAPTTPAIGGEVRSDGRNRGLPGGDIGAGVPAGGLGGDMSAGGASTSGRAPVLESDRALNETLGAALGGAAEAESFLRDLDAEIAAIDPSARIGGAISAWDTASRLFGFASLLGGRTSQSYKKRLPALLKAIRALQSTEAFEPAIETAAEYLDAAQDLAAKGGFRYVVFGHTHLAKSVPLRNGGLYLNSGTWADVLRFPPEILRAADEEAQAALETFVDHMKAGDFSRYTVFSPTYVRLDLGDDGKVARAELLPFKEPGVS